MAQGVQGICLCEGSLDRSLLHQRRLRTVMCVSYIRNALLA